MDQQLAKFLQKVPKNLFKPLDKLEGVLGTLTKSSVLMTAIMERKEGALNKRNNYYYYINTPYPNPPPEDELTFFLARFLKDQIVMTVA